MEQPFVFSAKEAAEHIRHITQAIQKVIIGKDLIILKVLIAILARGHILLEDMPGVGKTTLALAFSRCLDLSQRRIQFTPDVLPSDVTGFSVYRKETGSVEFIKGAAFTNILLADEINRTSPKTQSALLELMEEGSVTAEGETYPLPDPFFVLATQNPAGSIGTQMLPESQLDRFMLRLRMGYPDHDSEVRILEAYGTEQPPAIMKPVVTKKELLCLQRTAAQVYIDHAILRYVADIAEATRNHPLLKMGVSPRGSLALCAAARATALVRGRDYVIPDDIHVIASETLAHRLLLTAHARAEHRDVESILTEILDQLPVPELKRG